MPFECLCFQNHIWAGDLTHTGWSSDFLWYLFHNLHASQKDASPPHWGWWGSQISQFKLSYLTGPSESSWQTSSLSKIMIVCNVHPVLANGKHVFHYLFYPRLTRRLFLTISASSLQSLPMQAIMPPPIKEKTQIVAKAMIKSTHHTYSTILAFRTTYEVVYAPSCKKLKTLAWVHFWPRY